MASSTRPDRQNGHQWRRIVARIRRDRDVCEMPECVAPSRWIDKELKAPDPWSFSVDHIEPVSKRPDLALELSNCRAAHRVCNQKGQPAARRSSRDW